MIQVRDDRGRALTLPRAPVRVVSLVPSDTYTVARLAGVERLVGRTTYCEEPRGEIERVRTVGGTKDASLDAILALEPDLVIANQEENTRWTLEALARAGVPVLVVFPKTVAQGIALIARLARVLGVERAPDVLRLVADGYRVVDAARRDAAERPRLRVFCPIWMDPLMTIHGDTYMSDALDLAGAQNVFADRARRYPLAADLGRAASLSAERVAERDTRYPRVTFQELIARTPDAVLLPDEPHPFSAADADVFRKLAIPAAAPHGALADRVLHIRGKDVCWYGAWAVEGVGRLREVVRRAREGVSQA